MLSAENTIKLNEWVKENRGKLAPGVRGSMSDAAAMVSEATGFKVGTNALTSILKLNDIPVGPGARGGGQLRRLETKSPRRTKKSIDSQNSSAPFSRTTISTYTRLKITRTNSRRSSHSE